MVVGSILFAAIRKASLAYLLFFSTIAVGGAYAGIAVAPTLAAACAASVVGGCGNGIQWVTAISAVQELTVETMQARVMSVLESIGAAMPGVGFVIGGLIAALISPRMTFLAAGFGVIAIVIVMAPMIGVNLLEHEGDFGPTALDGRDEVVVELIPGAVSGKPSIEEGT
jgi:MFS family permease